ncbi:TIGR04222 domain-containing membrane protein [Paraburkholderia sp.]|uniref:TIGR04222 domain-containing membrane protein n=1 Tax=Paraburkholderia sp. TaxID=1926495 RepID=UPI003D6E9B55
MPDSIVVTVAVGLAFAAALYMTLVWRLWKARRIWRAGSTMQITKISAYQMALLSGGVSRVALTGVVRLLGRKILVPGVAGVLMENGTSHDELDAVEKEVLATARQPAVFRDLMVRLGSALKRAGLIRGFRDELIAIGYMRAFGSRRWWASYLINMLPFAVLIFTALGATTGLALSADERDTLLWFIGGAFITMLIVALPARVTELGRYIVWSATQHHPDFKTARAMQGDAIDIKILGQSVALYGPDALAGSDMAWIPAVLAQVANTD